MKTYKGTDKDMKCRGVQYEIGKTYETDKAIPCESGFHACENPLAVFAYYAPAGGRFFEVEQGGEISKNDDDSKVASTEITFGAEIGLTGLISRGVDYILEKVDFNHAKESNTGVYSAATNTGTYSAATNTGVYSAATNTGVYSAATNTGTYSAATNTGVYSAATNTGVYSAATNTGVYSAATNTGVYSAATNTGTYSAATNTGTYSAATNTGNHSAATVDGRDSIAIVTGFDSKAKGSLGCWIVVTERGGWSGETYPILCVKTAKVDGETIKADTYYKVENGEFVATE